MAAAFQVTPSQISAQKMSSDIPTRLFEAERSFRRACDHILALNRALSEMQKRYDHASRERIRMFRYSLRLRMAVTEGVRNMFYEYATIKADEVTELRCQISSDEELSDSEMESSDCDSDFSTNDDEDAETNDTALNFQSLTTSDTEANILSSDEQSLDSDSSTEQSDYNKTLERQSED